MFRTIPLLVALSLIVAAPAAAQVCSLVELDSVGTPGLAGQPLAFGSDAYVAAGTGGIVRIDLSNPSSLAITGSTGTSGEALDVVLEFFTNVLIIADGSGGIATAQIAGNGIPVSVGALAFPEAIISVAAAPRVFLAGGDAGSLYVFDLGGDLAPFEIGSVTVGGEVRGMVERSGTAFIALGAAGLGRVDISDTSAPQVLGIEDLGGAVTAVARRDDLLFAAVDGLGIVVLAIAPDGVEEVTSLPLPATPDRLIVWNDRVYAAGPDLGVVAADISLGDELLMLSTLDLPGATALALRGNQLLVGRGASGFSLLDVSPCANPAGTLTTRVIPAGARAEGASNSFWLTDAALANLSPGVATVSVAYLAKGADNSEPASRSMILGSGQQMLVSDLFESLFELDEANGALRLSMSHPDVKITSRTYNAAGTEGTYGQFIPALDVTQAVTPIAAGALLQLQESSDFRTNIGVVNMTDAAVEFRIRLYDAAGSELGVISQTLPPFGMNQYNAAYRIVGANVVDSGFAVVSVETEDGRVVAYASVVDRGSNDPILIPTQKLGADSPFND